MSLIALSSDNSWFKQLFESSPDPTWIIEGNQFVECNEAAIRALGYASREELLNTHPSKLSPACQPDGEDSFSKAERMMAMARYKGLHRFEWMHTKANGADFVAEVTLSNIDLMEKSIIYCVWRDISERRNFEARLIASEKRYQSLFCNSSEAIAVARADGTLEEVNARFAALLDYDAEELVGMSIERIHPADEMPKISKRFNEIFTSGLLTPVETKIVRRDGTLVEVEIRTTHIEIGERKIAQGIFTDLSERKWKEQQRLEEETVHRDTLVREVHHRIKNNLQSVAGLLQRELGRFPELNPRLEKAISQVNAIAVVHGLQSSQSNEAIRLCDSIRYICKIASELMQCSVEFHIENEQTTFDPVEIDSREAVSVALIINELVLNALKHSPVGAFVPTVVLSADGTRAQLLIRNALSSMTDFDIDTGKGLGTGLALVRSLMPEEGATLAYEGGAGDFLLTILRLSFPVVLMPKQKGPD